jgi:chromosomal replication initiation ATPase DnaA
MDMPKATFDTWVQHCEFVSFENGSFTIGVFNPYNREWLASRLTSTLVRLLTGIMNQTVEIEFIVLEQAVEEEEKVDPESQAHCLPDKKQHEVIILQAEYPSIYDEIVQPDHVIVSLATFSVTFPCLEWNWHGCI